jgi:hypothetical protein
MNKRQKGYTSRTSTWFIIILIISLFAVLSSCAVKKDCRGVKHYKQSGGFYL